MNHKIIVEELDRNKQVFEDLLSGFGNDMITWSPAPGKWNLLEIICHLCDEEKEDFRVRVKLVLTSPATDFPAIDPVAWVTERKYAEQDFEDKIVEFLEERSKSVAWLNSLRTAKWTNAYQHPKLGLLSAELLLANWLEHDLLHIRQIINLKHAYLKEQSGVDLSYAGNW